MSSAAPVPSDADLIKSLVGGDQDALKAAYDCYGGAVWSLARQVCRDHQLAEEVCQTVFTDLWSTPGRFDPNRGTLRAWLLAQAHARAVDLVRTEGARRRREDREAELTPHTTAEVEVAAQLALLSSAVRTAVDALPEDERAAIVLTYFGGHPYREAARLLGQPEGTVKSRIRTGLQRLRPILKAQGMAP